MASESHPLAPARAPLLLMIDAYHGIDALHRDVISSGDEAGANDIAVWRGGVERTIFNAPLRTPAEAIAMVGFVGETGRNLVLIEEAADALMRAHAVLATNTKEIAHD